MSRSRIFFVKSVMQVLLYIGGFTTLYYIYRLLAFLTSGLPRIFAYIDVAVIIVCFFVIGGAIVDSEKIEKQ